MNPPVKVDLNTEIWVRNKNHNMRFGKVFFLDKTGVRVKFEDNSLPTYCNYSEIGEFWGICPWCEVDL